MLLGIHRPLFLCEQREATLWTLVSTPVKYPLYFHPGYITAMLLLPELSVIEIRAVDLSIRARGIG
jgi:hypothetical protein